MEKKLLAGAVDRFIGEMRVRNWSPETIRAYTFRLERFAAFLDREHASVKAIGEVTPRLISDYQLWLCKQESERGGSLSPATQRAFLGAVRSFFVFCTTERLVLLDPTRELEMPKLGKRLPQGVLSPKEIRLLMRQPDLDTYVGLRDRAILETLYSSGLRNSELRNLTIGDVDLDRGYVTVVRGKGNKDRVVPLGKMAVHFVREYVTRARPHMMRDDATHTLFLSLQGRKLGMSTLQDIIHRCAKAAGFKRRVFPHGIRHTCATAMLQGRADIRYIGELLGHESLSSTAIYTSVSIDDLKRVHARSHPREHDLPADAEWDRTKR
jgi:integrase/recombinase XerD